MEEKKKGFWAWVKAHKKQLILAGISITAIAGIIIGNKNKDSLMDLWVSLKESIKKVPENAPVDNPVVQTMVPTHELVAGPRTYTPPQAPYDVSQHIRTLSGGRQHSADKAAEATAIGIVLLPNQTLVDSHTKCAVA